MVTWFRPIQLMTTSIWTMARQPRQSGETSEDYQYYDHSTCMYYDHSTCMYYDHSTCMYYDHIPDSIWDEFMLDDVEWGGPGGEAPQNAGGFGGPQAPQCPQNNCRVHKIKLTTK